MEELKVVDLYQKTPDKTLNKFKNKTASTLQVTSDYEKTDSPEKVVPADIEEIKKKVNDSFSVSGLNFSNLDGEN